MTISTQTSQVEYTADGTQTAFTYDFKVMQLADLKVYVNGLLRTTGFTVSGVGSESGGTVTFSVAPPNGSLIKVKRITTQIQELVLREFQKLPAAAIEANFDKIVSMIQELTLADTELVAYVEDFRDSVEQSGTDGTLRQDLGAPDSTVPIAGIPANVVALGTDKSNSQICTIDKGLADTNADGLRSAMGNVGFSSPTFYGPFERINGTQDTRGVFNFANFAGQTLGTSAPVGFVFHHYTDGTEIQIDNVGEANKMLVLKNAHNPTRRADKPADFVGTGTYISFDKHNYALGYSQTLGFIDKDFKLVWTGVAGIATLWQNRTDDGTAAFRLQTTNAHVNILDVLNGTTNQRSFSIRDDVSFTRTILRTETNRSNGIGLEAMDGDVWLLSNGDTSKRIKVNKPITATTGNTTLTAVTNQAVETQVPFLLRGYNTASLPSASTFSGCMIRVLDRASKPAYSDGTNWLFVATDAVVS